MHSLYSLCIFSAHCVLRLENFFFFFCGVAKAMWWRDKDERKNNCGALYMMCCVLKGGKKKNGMRSEMISAVVVNRGKQNFLLMVALRFSILSVLAGLNESTMVRRTYDGGEILNNVEKKDQKIKQ